MIKMSNGYDQNILLILTMIYKCYKRVLKSFLFYNQHNVDILCMFLNEKHLV